MPDNIEHVIVLMLENRSFDHFFGDVPGVDGSNPAHSNLEGPGSPVAHSQRPIAVRKMKPDPRHETVNVLRQIQGGGLGDMGGFVYDYALKYPNDLNQLDQVMAYFPLGGLPAVHALAQHGCVCDVWFSSVPGPTWANRFFAHSGTSQGWVQMPHLPFHPNFHMYDQPTIYDRLNERNIPWRIYVGDIAQSLLLYNQRKKENLRGYKPFSSFSVDVSTGDPTQFPAYVFIEPSYLPFGQNDQHPPHDVLKGDDLIATVYNSIRANEALWESTLLIVVWDEHGGFYDHVLPPGARPPDHNVQDGFDFTRYGVRVPALLISKWIAPGVFRPPISTVDHTSVLRYLIDKYQLGPLGDRVASAATISSAITNVAHVMPMSVGLAPHPIALEFIGAEIEPSFNDNQAALIEFTKHLELEMGASPHDVGMRALRATASPQGEIEVAKERMWRYIETKSL